MYLRKLFFLAFALATHISASALINVDTLLVPKVTDFELDGAGNNELWNKTNWMQLTQLDSSNLSYDTKFKIVYSDKGIYVLFSGVDKKITSTYAKDFEDLFKADVFEVFFHPQPATPIYLEYEVNALDAELVLMIPNLDHKIMGWVPWKYNDKRKVVKKVQVHQENNEMYKWTAELYFPLNLFEPLQNIEVKKGIYWNANFYRLDYDSGKMIKWSWAPINKSFHEFEKFGVLLFN
jgi:hypothetical protein